MGRKLFNLWVIVAAGVLIIALPACTGPRFPVGTAEQRARLVELRYPADLPFGDDTQVRAERSGGGVTLVNRGAEPVGPGLLWLNEQYVGVLEVVPVGATVTLDLNRFVNRYGETFPVGTLLAPDRAAPLVSADLVPEGTGERRKLTVWPDRRWFE